MAIELELPSGFENVQEIAKQPLISVPQCYVRSDHVTVLEPMAAVIPTVDLMKLADDDDQLEKFHSTCKDWGIFQLVNHGVNPNLLEKLKHEIEEFFKLPLEEKAKYKIRSGEVEGYGSIFKTDDQKLDWGDRLYMITNPIHLQKPHIFPELPSSLKNTLEWYFSELDGVAMRLLRFMGKAMKMEAGEIEELFDGDGMRSVRMTYYPPCPQPELVVGITPHSDTTGITILNQLNGVDGLQIKRDGVWMAVNIPKDAFAVNVGDIFEILSNGMYKSIEHRAMVNSEKERISVAMFISPKLGADIGPAKSLITPQNPPVFKTILMEKYVNDYFVRRKLDGKSYLEQMKIENA